MREPPKHENSPSPTADDTDIIAFELVKVLLWGTSRGLRAAIWLPGDRRTTIAVPRQELRYLGVAGCVT